MGLICTFSFSVCFKYLTLPFDISWQHKGLSLSLFVDREETCVGSLKSNKSPCDRLKGILHLTEYFRFEQDELKSLDGLQPASRSCREYV